MCAACGWLCAGARGAVLVPLNQHPTVLALPPLRLQTPPARLGNPKPAGPIFKSFAFDRAKIMHACEAV